MKKGICPKCNGARIKKMQTHDGLGDRPATELSLVEHKNPEAWIFKGTTYFKMYALACLDCGYVEFYLADFPASGATTSPS